MYDLDCVRGGGSLGIGLLASRLAVNTSLQNLRGTVPDPVQRLRLGAVSYTHLTLPTIYSV